VLAHGDVQVGPDGLPVKSWYVAAVMQPSRMFPALRRMEVECGDEVVKGEG